eukprot:5266673-Prymnesium_polylepis.1
MRSHSASAPGIERGHTSFRRLSIGKEGSDRLIAYLPRWCLPPEYDVSPGVNCEYVTGNCEASRLNRLCVAPWRRARARPWAGSASETCRPVARLALAARRPTRLARRP